MQAGVTHLLMCYHGNVRKENRRAFGPECVFQCVSLSKVHCCKALFSLKLQKFKKRHPHVHWFFTMNHADAPPLAQCVFIPLLPNNQDDGPFISIE